MIPQARLVVDASVAMKWYIPEAGSIQAAALLEGDRQLLAPELLVAEFGNVLWKKVRRGELAPDQAQAIADALVSACPLTLYPMSPLLGTALEIATTFQRSVYDAIYLALAVAEEGSLITADAKLFHALRGTELESFVLLLAGN